ncbi:ABC-2 transporter permease [Tissierella sp. MSJ-40]|uniref:ABC-2 transporter permease n=1 Tax=Tissierella simiarum TaxID=2841534 RepID=A0ABS6EAI8_9FIRM|nr:ABC-2 transporter permease [Tissierella simiarum]MBU5439936.1 ABC-2 transporter permease [Tissierella simiarum]
MLGLIKRDLNLMFSNKQNIFFLVLYVPFFLFMIDTKSMPHLYLVILVTYTHMLTIIPFSYDITYKTHLMFQSLPIKRRDIVIYKYLSIFIYFIFAVVYVGVYMWIINLIGFKNVDYFNVSMIKIALPLVMVSLSITIPAYFRLSPKIAQIFNIFIYILLFNILSININSIVNVGTGPILSIFKGINPIFIALGVFVLSIILSIKLYETKDLA